MKEQTKENIQLQKALDNFAASLLEIPKNANTPIAYNLKLLAVIADAVYLKQNLYSLLNNWKNKLPFIGEVGTEIDWDKEKDRLCDAWGKDTYNCNYCNAEFSELTIEHLPSIDKKDWSLWETDEKLDVNIDSDKYGQQLDPLYRNNIWYFVGQDFKEAAVGLRERGMATSSSIVYLTKGIRTLSYDSNYLLVKTLDKELDEIIDSMCDIENLMYKFQSIQTNKYLLDETMAAFFERLYTDDYWNDYKIPDGKEVREEYKSWQASYNRDMKITTLIGKQNLEFENLLKSGFLTPFFKENCCESTQITEMRKAFDDYFYDKDKNVRYAAAGRYIYAHQFKEDYWRQKTLAFFRFLYIDDMIGRHIHYLDKYYNNDALRLNYTKTAVKSSISELMDLKFGGNYLVSKNQHWIAIYRVVVDEKIFNLKPSKYKDFVTLMSEIAPEQYRIPLKLDSIKNISKTIYQKTIEDWKEDSNYEGWDSNMPLIAKEFRRILQRYLDEYYVN